MSLELFVNLMSTLFLFAYYACELYVLVLFARVILDLLPLVAPTWSPPNFVVVLANFVYRLTDPPLKFLGKYIPPIRFGSIAIDVGFIVLFVGIKVLQTILRMILL